MPQSKSIDKLIVLKDKVSKEVTTTTSTTSTTDAAKKMPLYDEKGVLLGYIAVYSTLA